MQPEPITLQVMLTQDEFLTIQMQYSKRRRIYICVLLVVMVACLSLIMAPISWGMVVFFLGLALVTGLFVFPALLKGQWKKLYASHAGVQKEADYTFSAEGIAAITPNGSNTYSWHEVYAALALPDGMLFFISRMNAYFLPRSAIGENWDAMLQYVAMAPARKRKLAGDWA